MAIEEQTRNAIALAFTNIVRQGPLNGQVNIQRMSLAIHTLLEHTEPGEGVELEALYHHLVVDNKAPQAAAIEAMLVLKSRESTFHGVSMDLPQACANLTPEQRDSIVQAFNSRATVQQQLPSFERPKTNVGTPMGGAPAVPGVGAPASSGGRQTGRVAKSDLMAIGLPNKRLLVALGGVAALLIASFIFNSMTAPPPLKVITFPQDSTGLPCANPAPPMAQGIARCVIPKALWEKEGEEGIRARGEITMTTVRTMGVTRLYVVTAEDSKIRMTL